MRKLVVVFILIGSMFTIQSKAQNSHLKVSKTFHIGSARGWDYIKVNGDYLYVSHGGQVNILDKKTGDCLGVIPNTPGVHGIAFVKSLSKGYTSNGGLNNVSVFDLKTNSV